MGHLLGYARVSTLEQDASLQLDALVTAGCYRVFTDTVSGAVQERPQLAAVLDHLRPGDTLVVWRLDRLDRLGRSLRHLIEVVADLEARGVGFRSLTESIDTTTPGGRLVFHLFGSIAEFERDLIRERTLAGLAAAPARGHHGGRPHKLSADQVEVVRQMYVARDRSVVQIAGIVGVSRATIYRTLKPSTHPDEATARPSTHRPHGT